MLTFNEMPVPEGYERVKWDDVRPGELVYLHCVKEDNSGVTVSKAYWVIRLHLLQLADVPRTQIQEYGERLLREIK